MDKLTAALRRQRQNLEVWWDGRQATVFQSARLKLTGFYLGVLIIFSLVVTLSVRVLAQRDFDQSGLASRGAVRSLLNNLYSVPPSDRSFNNFQNQQSAAVHRDLDIDVLLINLGALVIGGLVSYWYAGKALEPIEQAHAATTRFAADASHELRTPLASLKLENEVFLRQKKFKSEEALMLIRSNLEEVQRLESLAGNLLALTQYEEVRLELRPLVIKPLVEAAVESVKKTAQDKKISFKLSVPAYRVTGEGESLTRLIAILLDNALKYSPSGTAIYLDAVSGGGHYHLSVRDEGPGIAEDDLPYIFERLYRGDKARTAATPGYGLGLSLAQEIARANRAMLTARNYPGGGAQFVLTLSPAKNT